MDNSNMSKNRQNEYLGVNKMGKNIRKSPLHQPNFGNSGVNSNNNNGILGSSPARQPSQPQVYNISKNDFRSIVQQLTGSPSQNDPLPRPPSNPPKHPSMRLQRIRPPPLNPINRPPMPPVVVTQAPLLPRPHGPPMPPSQLHFNGNNNNNNNFARPPPHFGQPSPRGMNPLTPALSPISAYMRQLQNCIGEDGPRPGQPQQIQPQMQGQGPAQHHMPPQGNQYMPGHPPVMQQVPGQGPGKPPIQPPVPGQGPGQPPMQPPVLGQGPGQPPMQPQARGHGLGQHPMQPQVPGQGPGQPPMQPHQVPGQFQPQHPMHVQGPGHAQAQSPTSGLLPNPNMPPLPSPGTYGAGLLPSPTSGLLPSPTSQFLLPSPGGYFNVLSPTPRSPYPLLSPGSQFPPPLSPNFAFSPFGQYGILGSGPQPPLSPGISFPSSPSGFFPLTSPRWRDQ